MKKKLPALLLFCIPFLLAGHPPAIIEGDTQTFLEDVRIVGDLLLRGDLLFESDGKIPSTPSTKTTQDVTLYVRLTGDDANDCLTESSACYSIQEAIDRVPKEIHHVVTVDIGAGSFTAANIDGFSVGESGSFYINGVLSLATGLTGLSEGLPENSTSLNHHCTVTDDEGGWAVNELVGKIFVAAGEKRVIISNTSTVIAYAGGCIGITSYEIHDQKTVITSSGQGGYAGIETTNVTTLWPDKFIIRNLKKTDGTAMGFLMYAASGTLEYCYAAGQYWGYVIGQSPRVSRTLSCFAGASAMGGFFFQASGGIRLEDAAAELCVAVGGNAGMGFQIEQSVYVRVEQSFARNWDKAFAVSSVLHAHIHDSEGYDSFHGLLVDHKVGGNFSGCSNVWLESVFFYGNSVSGVTAENRSNLNLYGIQGTNTSAIGLQLGSGATLTHQAGQTLTITGASGDFSMDYGAQIPLPWSNLANPGDTVMNMMNGCRGETL